MATTHSNKTAIRQKTPDEELEATIRERFVDIRARAGRAQIRAWNRIAAGKGKPGNVPARLVKSIKRARLSREDARAALVAPLERYIDRLYGTAA